MGRVFNFLVAGVMSGAIYSLVAVGLNLVFGVMRFINVAHGDLVTVGVYAAITLTFFLDPSLLGSVVFAVVIGFAIGAVIQRGLVAAITKQGTVDERRGLVLTIGISFLVSNLILLAYGTEFRQGPGRVDFGPIRLGDVVLQAPRLMALIGSLVLSTLLMAFLRFSRTGLAIRATSQNPDAALASGIDIRRVQTVAFSLSAALAAAAGALLAPFTFSSPALGFPLVIKAFIVVIIGGLGNVFGALIAGYGLGVVESLSVMWLPTGYNVMLGPVLMLVVLLLRPQGIFGKSTARA